MKRNWRNVWLSKTVFERYIIRPLGPTWESSAKVFLWTVNADGYAREQEVGTLFSGLDARAFVAMKNAELEAKS